MKFKKRKVGIIATIGPASFSPKIIQAMASAGMTIGRINTKYGNEKEWESNIVKLRKYKIKSPKVLDWAPF